MPDRERTTERRLVNYRGRVQGVGFRYTVVGIARRHPVVGYVKNLPDGSVELAVEAQPAAVRNFLDDVAEAMSGYIDDVTWEDLPSGESFDGFGIRY